VSRQHLIPLDGEAWRDVEGDDKATKTPEQQQPGKGDERISSSTSAARPENGEKRKRDEVLSDCHNNIRIG
jgi:hypothetical protein